MPEHESLIARIRQMRRASARAAEPRPSSPPARTSPDTQMEELTARVQELEHLVQGLQDSVYREATRQGKRIAQIEEQIQPAALGRALSDDARQRGL